MIHVSIALAVVHVMTTPRYLMSDSRYLCTSYLPTMRGTTCEIIVLDDCCDEGRSAKVPGRLRPAGWSMAQCVQPDWGASRHPLEIPRTDTSVVRRGERPKARADRDKKLKTPAGRSGDRRRSRAERIQVRVREDLGAHLEVLDKRTLSGT